MGNHHSQPPPVSSVDVVRRPPSRPNAPPSSRPISELGPKGPSHLTPENQVLPKELPIMKLRPVSMELSKFNPEYQDIFAYNDNEDFDNTPNDIDENIENLSKSPPRPPPPTQNGYIPNTSIDKDRPVSQVKPVPNGILKHDSKKNVKMNGSVPYKPTHRRQMSASGASNLTGQEHVIFEEPEEIERGKIDPLYQSYPGVSLPVKNNFNLDYSYQLTYVQLAESRRQKTLEELERRTGKKVSDLSADLSDNVERQEFIRDAYSRASTRSTGSTGSGLTNKKKKAPPPPSHPPPAPPAPPSKSGVPMSRSSSYSVENEPIPDYDLSESPKRQFVLPRYAVGPTPNSVPPPPPPQPNSTKTLGNSGKKTKAVSRQSSMSDGKPEILLRKTPSLNITPKSPEISNGKVPWLLEIKSISESKAARRQISQESSEIEPPTGEIKDADDSSRNEQFLSSSQTKLIFESSKGDFKSEKTNLSAENDGKEEVFALEELDKSIGEENYDDKDKDSQLNAGLERKGSHPTEKQESPKLARHHSSTVFDRKQTPSFERANSSPGDPVRRLNSLLQHDIKVTAQAKCRKLVKQTTPVPPKPKDPHEIFRALLSKACDAREERVKVEGTIDDKLKTSASDASLGRVLDENDNTKISSSNNAEKSVNKERKNSSNEAPEVQPKPPRYHKNVTLNKQNSHDAWKQKASAKSSVNNSKTPRQSADYDWTPEDDLDSDDNLSDREELSMRKGASEGFKSSIIPNSVMDLKSQKKQKGNKFKKNTDGGEDQNTAKKFGSVKKLKKSVHKSVKSAFGSISKASGKLLRKQRTEDMEPVEDAPKNWKFSAKQTSKGTTNKDNSHIYRMSNGFRSETESEDEHLENDVIEFDSVVPNGDIDTDDETSDEGMEEKIAQNIKRAGVAYVNDKGELVVFPDDEPGPSKYKVENDHKGIKSDKKNKNKKQDKKGASVRDREKRMEEERRKQLELELEMHKIREAETRERLQRLEAAQMQQHINAQLLQQQQQQNYTMLSAPPLPPAGGYPPNYSNRNDNTQNTAFPNLFSQQLPQNPYLTNTGLYGQPPAPILNGSVPNLTYNLDEYMRMLGLQTPPTSQQMAFFLNNMTYTGLPQQYERKSNPTLYDILHPEPIKQPCGMQAIDPSANKHLNMWTSSPNLTNEKVNEPVDPTINEYVNSYQYNGANEKDKKKASKSRNPVYSSDDSDGGLSPSRTMARAQVDDFRNLPVRTESGKFMEKYRSPLMSYNNSKSVQDSDLPNGISLRQQGGSGSVSPSNSVSTIDSTPMSPAVSIDTPSSPGKSSSSQYSPAVATKVYGPTGFKTVVDFSKGQPGSQVT